MVEGVENIGQRSENKWLLCERPPISGLQRVERMSLDAYIDKLREYSCYPVWNYKRDCPGIRYYIDKACIINRESGEMLTSESHEFAFKLSPSEAAIIAETFRSKDFSRFLRFGIACDSLVYTMYCSVRDFYGEYVLALRNDGGIRLQATDNIVIVAHWSPVDHSADGCTRAMWRLVDDLKTP